MIAGGGTGGHYYPAIAIADALQEYFSEYFPGEILNIHYIGSSYGLEKDLVTKHSFESTLLPIRGFARHINIHTIVQNLMFPFRVVFSAYKVYRLMHRCQVDAFIGTGSYAMGIPGIIARFMGIPIYLQEQNAYPGVTTRNLARHANILFYAFDEVKKYIHNPLLRFIRSGNPVRKTLKKYDIKTAREYFGLDPDKKTIFAFGGSQGALSINNILKHSVSTIMQRWNFQIIWQTGITHYEAIRDSEPEIPGLVIRPYIHEMDKAYSAADLVISRAGALTIAELETMQVPAILIPLPTAAANHQLHNARSLEKSGGIIVVEDASLAEGTLVNTIQFLFNNPGKLEQMRHHMETIEIKNAVGIITEEILTDLRKVK